jgi:hypothetical protein
MTINGRRLPILLALEHLDDEAFNFLTAQLWQLAKERGGFADKEGLARLAAACDIYITDLERAKTP